ncbi:hypothetical protein BC834DRAFT_872406 [Gloeopeniophorella convolvens]|nr:hypothetical protein BC834DRAFT_872406 [Gloeopeniophorella convolvens]
MANIDPGDIPLPPFLEPVLTYFASALPPAVYTALITFCAHGLAFLTALFNLGSALIASKPWEWDAQKILPPLITLLAAYLALSSALRTASWFIRTTTWLIKWGVIMSALAAGAAWVFAGGRGIVPALTGLLLDTFNGHGQDATGGPRRARPHAWEPFDSHREWQYEEGQRHGADAGAGASEHVQQFVAGVLERARGGNFWAIARAAFDGVAAPGSAGDGADDGHGPEDDQNTGRRTQARRGGAN